MTTLHTVGNDSLVSHAYNGSKTQMALSVNTKDVYLLSVPKTNNGKFQVIDILKEHTALVTGVDWAQKTNRIVTSSIDRNAYVWNQQPDGKWKPSLVVLMMDLSAICVRWSPLEDRFAVGSGCKLVAVCSYDQENDWWVSKRIKKSFKSTVTCVDWHPNNAVLACGSSDFCVRVFSAYIKTGDVESKWGKHNNVGSLLFEHYENKGGWVLSVSFSADGNKLLWVKHNSVVLVADVSNGGKPVVSCLYTEFLPFTTCLWTGPSTFAAAGYDCCPMAFKYSANGVQFLQKLGVKGETKESGKLTAMKKFQDIDRMATSNNQGVRLETLHQNCINELRVFAGDRSAVTKMSSIGRDGNLVFWDLPSLANSMSQLTVS